MKTPGRLLASGRDADIFEYGTRSVLRRSRAGRSMRLEASRSVTVLHRLADVAAGRPRSGEHLVCRDGRGLRKDASAYAVLTPDEARAHLHGGRILNLAPLCGGIPPDVGRRYLEAAAAVVAPAGA